MAISDVICIGVEEEEKVSESQHQQPHVMNGVDGPLIQPHQHMNGLSTSTGGQLG